MAYSKKVEDYYNNNDNIGSFQKDEQGVGTGLVGAPACGDVMKLQIKVNDTGIITDAKFKTFGCGSAIASSSLIAEWVKGKNIDQAQNLGVTIDSKYLNTEISKFFTPSGGEINRRIQEQISLGNLKVENGVIRLTSRGANQVRVNRFFGKVFFTDEKYTK
jgi:nitrogen fixation NifU-like protein